LQTFFTLALYYCYTVKFFYIQKYFNVAKQCLEYFVIHVSHLYGRDFVVYNVHNLLHLCDDVERFGCINEFSCFPFENYLGLLKNKINSKKEHTRIEENDNIREHEAEKVGDSDQREFFWKIMIHIISCFHFIALICILPSTYMISTKSQIAFFFLNKVCVIKFILFYDAHFFWREQHFSYNMTYI
jgi:hypothetical protein